MSDWEEIKRLAADLQKAQSSSTVQKLSERNCIEIITHLIQKKQLQVIFTNDGKEYITPEHLAREMLMELEVHGGRINLTELAKILNVDLSHVTGHVGRVRKDKNVSLVLGQLIDNEYLVKIAVEINERLNGRGRVSLSELTVMYDLPAEFLQKNVVDKQLGKLIHAKYDPIDSSVLYTDAFINRVKARLRGALAALTRPTPIQVILNNCDVHDTTFFALVDQLGADGVLTGRNKSAQYVPHVFARSQASWVTNFYRQNNYLEYAAMQRMMIYDPKTYIKKQFPNDRLIFLRNFAISHVLIDQLEGSLDECLASKTFIDVQSLIPTNFDDADIEDILEMVLPADKRRLVTQFAYFVLSNAFLDNLQTMCNDLVDSKAREAVDSGKYQKYMAEKTMMMREMDRDEPEKSNKRDDRRKKGVGGKSGGGTQGRETKTKSTKKHVRGSKVEKAESSDEDSRKKSKTLQLIALNDIGEIIKFALEDEGLDEIVEDVAHFLHEKINGKALEMAASLHLSSTANAANTRRQTHTALQDKLNALLNDVRLFDKGLKLMPGVVQEQLEKYLLKSLCTDICNEMLFYLAGEFDLNVNGRNLTQGLTYEQRLKLANDCPKECREKVVNLVKCLAGSSIDDFLKLSEPVLETCSMILKKIDKKKDRVLILNHKHNLLEQLHSCDDPALVLHLTVLILFISATQQIIHANGKLVSALISFLKPYLNDAEGELLGVFYDLVTQSLSSSSDDDKNRIQNELNEKIDAVKDVAINFKKNAI